MEGPIFQEDYSAKQYIFTSPEQNLLRYLTTMETSYPRDHEITELSEYFPNKYSNCRIGFKSANISKYCCYHQINLLLSKRPYDYWFIALSLWCYRKDWNISAPEIVVFFQRCKWGILSMFIPWDRKGATGRQPRCYLTAKQLILWPANLNVTV